MLIANIMHGTPMAAEPAVTSRPVAASPEPGAVAAMEPARYISPRLSFDMDIGVMIAEYRDVQSGELKAQFPSEAVVDRYRRSEALEAARRDHGQSQGQGQGSAESATAAPAAAEPAADEGATPAPAPAPMANATAEKTKTALSSSQPALVA